MKLHPNRTDRGETTVPDAPDHDIRDLSRTRLEEIRKVEPPEPLKDEVPEEDLTHRQFEKGRFWSRIPAFRDVTGEEFSDHRFQVAKSATSVAALTELLQGLVDADFIADVQEGIRLAPMSLRLSPYLLSLVDWDNPYEDPIRRQFIPVASTRLPDHPHLTLDSLAEREDSPTPGLVHRYPDKALFLALDVCPVYCRFCTRSYAIGENTEEVEKADYKSQPSRWAPAFAYVASRPEIEDVVVSGGDVYHLSPRRLAHVGRSLLAIPHVRRVRFATKGPAVMPMKVLSDHAWTEALLDIVREGRVLSKEVCVHTHFNCTREITSFSRAAMDLLFRNGVKVRNQAVLIRGVNDSAEQMSELTRKLAWMNVQPYYVYQHDMVRGVEELRTRLADTLELERCVRGSTAGFNTPTFVLDAPGGGGKRDAHSYDHYDETTGVSVYRSPAVDRERIYLYFDPIDLLPAEGRARWADPTQHEAIVDEAIRASGLENLQPALGG